MARVPQDCAVTAPLGITLMVGIVTLLAVGVFFLVRGFTDDVGGDPQALAAFRTDEVQDRLVVQHAEAGALRSDFQLRTSVPTSFDDAPPTPGLSVLGGGIFVGLGGGTGPDDGPLSAGTAFSFCSVGGPAGNVEVEVRHLDSNSLVWKGRFISLRECP